MNIREANIDAFSPVFQALTQASNSGQQLTQKTGSGIDKIIQELQTIVSDHSKTSPSPYASKDISLVKKNLRTLKLLKKTIEKADVKDVKSAEKLTKKIQASVEKINYRSSVDHSLGAIEHTKDRLKTINNQAVKSLDNFKKQLAVAQVELTKVQSTYKASKTTKEPIQKVVNFFKKSSTDTLQGILRAADRLEMQFLENVVNPGKEVGRSHKT